MSKHDYSQNTVSNVSSTILNCKDTIGNTVLSTESMSYSWDDGIIHNVVTLSEVLEINTAKSELEQIFQKVDSKFDNAVQKVEKADSASAESLKSGSTTLSAIKKKAELVLAFTKLYPTVSVVGCFENLHTFINSVDEEYNIVDFDKLSDEELKEYCQRILKKAKSGELSSDDKNSAKSLLNYMSDYHVSENMTESDKEKIKMFNDLYEELYPDQAARVNVARAEYENQRGSEVMAETKYQIYSEYLDSGDVSDDFIKHQIEAASNFPKGLYRRVCNAQDNGRCIGTAGSVDEMDSNSYYRQGTTSVYNIQSHRNDDGSVNISFSVANSTKRYTEITLYDSEGNIIRRDYLKGQQDPSSISEVFGEGGKIWKDIVSGNAFKVNCESFNSKDNYSYTIPEGGYIQITEDPNEMNRGAYKQQIINSMSTKAIDITLDSVKVDTGNAVVDFGVDVVKSWATKTAKDQLNGTSTSLNDYGEELVSTTTDSTIDAIATAGKGNPAGLGLLGIKTILKLNSASEGIVRDIQQNKSKGNGSLYICN